MVSPIRPSNISPNTMDASIGWRRPLHAPDLLGGDSHTNSESTFTVVKVNSAKPIRETLPNIREVVLHQDKHHVHTWAISAEHRDNLRETESVSLWSRLVGGGASPELTLLCRKFPVSEKSTGKIVIAVGFSPFVLRKDPSHAAFCRFPGTLRMRKNRELTGNG